MTYRPSISARAALLAFFVCAAMLFAVATSAEAAELDADFHFNGTRSAPTGHVIADMGTGNAFVAESVDGAVATRQVLGFPTGNGLSLPTTGLAESGSYSVVMLVRLDSASPGRRKLLDFSSGSSDAGLYLCDGRLVLELLAATPCPIGPGFEGDWAQVALTRDGATGDVHAYLGDDAPSAVDTGTEMALDSEVRFFRDDELVPSDEHSGGAVARIRVFDGVLSPTQIEGLDRVDTAPPAVGLEPVPTVTADPTPAFSGAAGSEAGDLGDVTLTIYEGSSATGTPVTSLAVARQGASWSAVSPEGLDDGTYTARAEQPDGAGNRGLSETRVFTVDTTAPAVSLGTPTNQTVLGDHTPNYSGVAGNGPGDSQTVTVKVYSGSAASGTPVQTLTATRSDADWWVEGSQALGDGTYTAQAEQLDSVGNRGVSGARTFTVDTVASGVSLETPAGGSETNDSTPTYSGAAGNAPGDGGTVTVKVYSGSVASGATVQELSAPRSGDSWLVEGSPELAEGVYTAQAEQSDEAGNTDWSDPVSFSIDLTPPDTALTSGPPGVTNDSTPEFAFSSQDGVAFVCRVYRADQPAAPDFGQCASPRVAEPLADASYVFEVATVDAAGNQDTSPATRGFRVDTVAPRIAIVAAPADTTAADAAFVFSSDEAADFSCRLDGGAWQSCGSPQSYSGLAMGPHGFGVRATDQAGNQGDPASHSWQVLKPGLRIPGTGAQAVALAREIVQLRKALKRLPLRRAARRKSIMLKGFDAPTAGNVEFWAQALVRGRPGGPIRKPTLAYAHREVEAAGRYTLPTLITKRGRRLARTQRKLRVELTLRFTDRAGRSLLATTKTTMVR
jgi:Bacterial Ig-like domain